MKAFGTGWGGGVNFADIEVRTEDNGRPVVTLTGGAKQLSEQRGIASIHISLSHERDNAIAFVVLEG
jgi:holo-[acyl-carrier protein] synthase